MPIVHTLLSLDTKSWIGPIPGGKSMVTVGQLVFPDFLRKRICDIHGGRNRFIQYCRCPGSEEVKTCLCILKDGKGATAISLEVGNEHKTEKASSDEDQSLT